MPGCGEEITSVGPSCLKLEIDGHNRAFHPEGVNAGVAKVAKVPYTWICPRCHRDVSRSSDDLLDLAIKGHNRFYHWQEDLEREKEVRDQTTPEDRDWLLKELKVVW